MDRVSGVITSLVTPFSDNKIDYSKLESNLTKMNKTAVTGYLALGGNSEAQAMTEEVKKELLTFIRRSTGGKLLIAGIYNESAALTLDRIREYHELGAEMIRLAPLHYFPYLINDDLLLKYYTEIADKSPVPIILYNAPALSGGVSISFSVANQLSVHPMIWGIKDSSLTGLYKFINIRRNNKDFHILAGSASFFFPALMAGVSGGDMTAANYLPDACCRLYSYVQEGQLSEAKDLHGRLLSVNTFISGNWGFCGVKAAMNIMGFEGGQPRAPYSLPGKDSIRDIEILLRNEGF